MAKKVAPDPYFPDEVEEVKPAEEPKPEEPKSKKKYSTPDGPRYTVGLQTDHDLCCYKDFFETEKLRKPRKRRKQLWRNMPRKLLFGTAWVVLAS